MKTFNSNLSLTTPHIFSNPFNKKKIIFEIKPKNKGIIWIRILLTINEINWYVDMIVMNHYHVTYVKSFKYEQLKVTLKKKKKTFT